MMAFETPIKKREPLGRPWRGPLNSFCARLFGAAVALTFLAGASASAQQLELKVMAPAAPGGGWDQTARAMQQSASPSLSTAPRAMAIS
jgi:hypothetical protein